jgi:hypothetical protein
MRSAEETGKEAEMRFEDAWAGRSGSEEEKRVWES